jgi:hypothetical protein
MMHNEQRARSVVDWLKSHKYFKWTKLCTDIEIDPANFQKTMNKEPLVIPTFILDKMTAVMKQYGYQGPVEYKEGVKSVKIEGENGKPIDATALVKEFGSEATKKTIKAASGKEVTVTITKENHSAKTIDKADALRALKAKNK